MANSVCSYIARSQWDWPFGGCLRQVHYTIKFSGADTCIDVDVMSAPLHTGDASVLHEEFEMTSLCK